MNIHFLSLASQPASQPTTCVYSFPSPIALRSLIRAPKTPPTNHPFVTLSSQLRNLLIHAGNDGVVLLAALQVLVCEEGERAADEDEGVDAQPEALGGGGCGRGGCAAAADFGLVVAVLFDTEDGRISGYTWGYGDVCVG